MLPYIAPLKEFRLYSSCERKHAAETLADPHEDAVEVHGKHRKAKHLVHLCFTLGFRV